MEDSQLRKAFINLLSREDYPNVIRDLVFEISLYCFEKEFIKGDEINPNFNHERYKRQKK